MNALKRNSIVLLFGIMAVGLLLSCGGSQKTVRKDTLKFVSVEEELALGKALRAQAFKQIKLVRNHQITDFLNGIARELGAQSDWKGLDYSVYVVNDANLNHFSLPGGSIFIFRGLLEVAENAAEVAMIIAHEVAHLSSRDGVDRVASKYAYAFAAQSVVGEIPEIPAQIITNLYSEGTILDYAEEDEYFADKRAVKYAWRANYDPSALLTMLEKLRAAEKTNPRLVRLLQATHPPITSRYKRVRIEIEKMPRKRSLRLDLPEFKKIKETLEKIP